MTKGEVLVLYRNLNQTGELNGVKFAYAVSRNIDILKREIESIEKTLELPEDFKEFETKRIALAEKYAERDEKGKTLKEKATNGSEQFVIIPANQKKFDKEFDVLRGEYKEAVALRDKQIEEYTKLLTEESDVVPYKIKLEDVPKEITTRQMTGIYDIIDGGA